jgi:hypothetical protein
MGLLNFFGVSKSKKESFDFPERDELDIPPAPPSVGEELESFPSAQSTRLSPLSFDESPVDEVEDEAVKVVREGLQERESLELTKPIFVRYKYYKAMLDEVGQLKIILKEAEDTLDRMEDFKEDEDKEFAKWRRELDDLQRKLIYVDKTLFGK